MKTTTLALAAVMALSTGAAFAQPAAPAGPGPGPRAQHQRLDPAQMAERRAEHLRTILQLRPEQEPALKTFLAATAPNPDKLRERRAERGEGQALTTPQRLDRQSARMAERQKAFATRADATKRFYAQLNPSQQKAFDALRQGGGKHGGKGGHRGGGRGHGFRA
jgi:protein CpxP